MKRKLLFAIVALMCSVGSWGQSYVDITSTALKNPSFELASEGVELTSDVASDAAPYGWTISTGVQSKLSSSTTTSIEFTNGAGGVTPKNGSYFYESKVDWAYGSRDGSISTTTNSLEVGYYYTEVYFKAADICNNSKWENGTALGIDVTDASSATLISKSKIRIAYSMSNAGGGTGSDVFLKDGQWDRMGVIFKVTTAGAVTITFNQTLKSRAHSELLYDNVKLYRIYPTSTPDGATALPLDIAGVINNANFATKGKLNWTDVSNNIELGGLMTNYCAERWSATFDLNQTVSGLLNGKYKLTCQGFYRAGGAGNTTTTKNVKLYAGSQEEEVLNILDDGAATSGDGFSTQAGDVYVPNSMSEASQVFTAGHYSDNEVISKVTNGTLKIGIKKSTGISNDWALFDNFQLHLIGLGVENFADAYTSPASVDAGKWYVFNVSGTGNYRIISDVNNSITYTQDGSDIESEISSEATLTADTKEVIALTEGKLYFKVTSDASLTIEPDVYSYTVGDGTPSVADNGYTQSKTMTITFSSASTNDPAGVFSLLDASKIKVNSVAASASLEGKVLTITLASTLATATDYAVSVEAGAVGYNVDHTNADISLTAKTPEVFDGFYFLRTSAGKYVSRGGDYNTRAIVDEFGLPLSIATNASGITQFTYVDGGGKLFLNGSGNAFTDSASPADWTLQSTVGGYYLLHANEGSYKGKKLTVWGTDNKSLFAGDDGSVFEIEPVSEHNTFMEALKDAQAATAATAAGISAATKSALATELAANYNAENVSVDAESFTEKWNGNASAGNEYAGNGKDMYTKTISDLPEGLYKLTVNAYYRINDYATSADGARANVYLYGGTAKTQLYSIHDFPAAEGTYSSYQRDAYGDYPDNATAGNVATTSGYLTELYVYHEGGDFTYGIHQPSRFSNGQWFGFQKFTLTRYTQTSANMAITDAKYATFVAPFDVAIPSGVDAYKILSATGSTLNLTSVETTIPANTPVVLYSESTVNETFKGKSIDGTPTVGLLTGVYEATAAPVGSYVLQKNDEKVGFYQVVDGKQPTVGANRAYMDAAAPGVKAFYFDEGTATAIQDVFSGVAEGEIYDISGRKVSKMQKGGVYVVNGQKVIIK